MDPRPRPLAWLASLTAPRRRRWIWVTLLVATLLAGWWARPALLQSAHGPDPSIRLFVFVSRSLPDAYARDLQTQLSRVTSLPVSLVLRGTMTDQLLPDLQYWTMAPTGTQLPVWIDPLLYQKYRIETVPSFLLVSGYDPDCPACPDSPDTQAWMLHGAVSLEHVLERLDDASHLTLVHEALREVRSGFFQQ